MCYMLLRADTVSSLMKHCNYIDSVYTCCHQSIRSSRHGFEAYYDNTLTYQTLIQTSFLTKNNQ